MLSNRMWPANTTIACGEDRMGVSGDVAVSGVAGRVITSSIRILVRRVRESVTAARVDVIGEACECAIEISK